MGRVGEWEKKPCHSVVKKEIITGFRICYPVFYLIKTGVHLRISSAGQNLFADFENLFTFKHFINSCSYATLRKWKQS